MSNKMVRDVKMTDGEQLEGRYIVLWRNETKQPCKVISVDKDKCEIRYEIVAGPDKGKKLKSRYDSSQTVVAYEDGAAVLACLDT